MITWKTYYIETQRRQDEIDQAAHNRLVGSVTVVCETGLTSSESANRRSGPRKITGF